MTTNVKPRLSLKDYCWYGLTIVSISIGVIITMQNFYMSRETERQQHRLDIGDAYFYKALIDRSKKLEEGYYAERRHNEKIRQHCKSAQCNLPVELAVSLIEIKVEPLDNILTNKLRGDDNGNE